MAAKKTTAKKKRTKADFVRSLPKEMPAQDVIAKAKEAGITLNEDTVYKTRSGDKKKKKGKGKKSSAAGKKSATKARNGAAKASTSPKTRGRSPDKKNHVLALAAENPSWGAAEVAKAAKCSTNYVYSVWRKPKGKGKSGAGMSSKKNGSPAVSGGSPDAKVAFTQAVQSLGVKRARTLLDILAKLEQA